MTEDQIKHMVDRFLQWRFPDDMSPDGGISIKRFSNEGTSYEHRYAPVGTNLLSAAQANVMVRHMLEGLPPSTARNDEPVTANYGKQHLSGPAVEAIESAQDTEELAAPPSPDTVREALQALEAACQKIAAGRTDDMYHDMINAGQQDDLLDLDNARRNARAALSSAPVAPAAPVAGTQKTHHINGPFASPIKAGERDLGVCLDCGVNDGDDHMPGCSALAHSRNDRSTPEAK